MRGAVPGAKRPRTLVANRQAHLLLKGEQTIAGPSYAPVHTSSSLGAWMSLVVARKRSPSARMALSSKRPTPSFVPISA